LVLCNTDSETVGYIFKRMILYLLHARIINTQIHITFATTEIKK